MVVGGFTEELKSRVSPARLWKAAVSDVHIMLPKIVPEFVGSMEIVQGDGGVGTIKATTFTHAVKELSVVKIIVDEIDEEKLYYKYSVIEGGNPNYESTSYTYKFELSEDGGCLCKLIGEFKTIGDYEPTDQDKVLSKEGFITTFMAIDAYLQANPNECA
ncbi:major strawberry allergen Fra a 1-2-like [Dioscorea cayenensis subsp. rotundata]|uniref:Major strawberry allergen Fra a 1-2-like n=1 Tax=Dioscorea cayennensis subsp. rotundata TaxID=55577 RepID=A0AB40BIP4_DIOCR|nr:major strawberry allergen Fra a 1-2-like [Dioscorea cayenensis subsp. rotundata]